MMMFPQLAQFTDLSLLLLRLMVAAIFVTSGWSHLSDPKGRTQSIGLRPAFTAFLGAAELAGGLGVAFGVLTQLAAIGLILVMLGAIHRKVFVWHTGFWGEKVAGCAARRVTRTEAQPPDEGELPSPGGAIQNKSRICAVPAQLIPNQWALSGDWTVGKGSTVLNKAGFNGYALWTYLTTPFLLAMDGVLVEETERWREGAETWRVLRAYFPGSIETHSLVQNFFFGEDFMLRRHDYSVNIAGGFGAAQLTSNYVTANGVRLPTKRRAYTRGPDRQSILDMLMVSIDISEIRYE